MALLAVFGGEGGDGPLFSRRPRICLGASGGKFTGASAPYIKKVRTLSPDAVFGRQVTPNIQIYLPVTSAHVHWACVRALPRS